MTAELKPALTEDSQNNLLHFPQLPQTGARVTYNLVDPPELPNLKPETIASQRRAMRERSLERYQARKKSERARKYALVGVAAFAVATIAWKVLENRLGKKV